MRLDPSVLNSYRNIIKNRHTNLIPYSQALLDLLNLILPLVLNLILPLVLNLILPLDSISKQLLIKEGLTGYMDRKVLADLIEIDSVTYTDEREEFLHILKSLEVLEPEDLKRYEMRIEESKTQIFQRKVPKKGILSSAPSYLLLNPLFLDSEITKVSQIFEEHFFKTQNYFIKYAVSENSKIVIQQQAIKSCGHTCAFMLLKDEGLSPNPKLLFGHLTKENTLKKIIEAYGFKEFNKSLKTLEKEDFLQMLRKNISHNGSAIIEIFGMEKGQIGGHAIICDEISEDLGFARIRDPWHGWEITIKSEALLKSVSSMGKNSYETIIHQILRKES
jgi:hypothetical protein